MDEDSHYCLKCGTTVIGIENYINHRKVACEGSFSAVKMEIDEGGGSNELSTEDNYIMKHENSANAINEDETNVQADDFFSSLELQSSSKSSNMITMSFPNKLSGGIVTRSKTSLTSHSESVKAAEKTESTGKAKKPRKVTTTVKRKRATSKNPKKTKQKAKRTAAKVKNTSENGPVPRKPLSKMEEDFNKSPAPEKKDDNDWMLFNHLGLKKSSNEDIDDGKKNLACETNTNEKRYTPELFSMSPILMSDVLAEDKDEDVDKFLGDDSYDDGYYNLDGIDEFTYAPPRSDTSGKWKADSLSGRTSPMLWETLLDAQHNEEDNRTRPETPFESTSEPSPTIAPAAEKPKEKFPLVTYSGGKWKPLAPPSTHTGGKWKPSEAPQATSKGSQEIPPATHTGGKWKPGNSHEPPATYTGGKWKPNSGSNHTNEKWKNEGSSREGKSTSPPADHTQGKWAPALPKSSTSDRTLDVLASSQATSGKCLKTSGGGVQYYCSPCNRRLASKKMYKNHILSELHFKRVLQENDLECNSRALKLFHGLFSMRSSNQRGLGKRIIKKPEFLKNMELGNIKKIVKTEKPAKKRITRKEVTQCEVCKTKHPSHQFGKHLVSYYHSRRAQLSDPEEQKIVLDNIHAIVQQAPFQCGICKFYCNTHKLFKAHWKSAVHKNLENAEERMFWCSFCDFECYTAISMELHLDSNSHREVILAVNKSIPIVIRQRSLMQCQTCPRVFRYNRGLARHMRVCHEQESSEKSLCLSCGMKFKSIKALQKHTIISHQGRTNVPYFCSVCDVVFKSAQESKKHRNTQDHKCKSQLRKMKNAEKAAAALSRACPFCSAVLEDTKTLKTHIDDNHPSLRSKCSSCGEVFALSQEVTRHTRGNECSFHKKKNEDKKEEEAATAAPSSVTVAATAAVAVTVAEAATAAAEDEEEEEEEEEEKKEEEIDKIEEPTDEGLPDVLQTCERCPYTTYSKSELLYHGTLHQKQIGEKGTFFKIACPICGKQFRRSALKIHLRSHTGERPFKCHICGKTYVRRDILSAHLRYEHSIVEMKKEEVINPKKLVGDITEKPKEIKKTAVPKLDLVARVETVETAETMETVETVETVEMEETIVEFRCTTGPSCTFTTTIASELDAHKKTHVRVYQCTECNYKAKTNTLLKRHNKIHLGEKSFHCPHCPFQGRLSSHLKRHLRLHTGAKPYKCPHCSYQCNILENLRKHVLYTKIHPGKMLYECKACQFATNNAKEFKDHVSEHHNQEYGTKDAISAIGIYNHEEDAQQVVNMLPVKTKPPPTPTPPPPPPPEPTANPICMKTARLEAAMVQVLKKLEPIAPKPAILLKRPNLKTSGNTVEDKRKVLEMELAKLKNQAKKNTETPVNSQPSTLTKVENKNHSTLVQIQQTPAVLIPVQERYNIASNGLPMENGTSLLKTNDEIVFISVPSTLVAVNQPIPQPQMLPIVDDESSAYILYDNRIETSDIESIFVKDLFPQI